MRPAVVLLACLLVLTGCSAPAPGSDAPTTATAGAAEFALAADFPDPDVVEVDGVYYAYATQGRGETGQLKNVQVATSPDLEIWTLLDEDALPTMPDWATVGDTWAPDVSVRDDGSLVMFFTATDTAAERQCIGVAEADRPEGPFKPLDPVLVCPAEEGGAIDPATFVDADGSAWLLFKNDGNCCNLDTWLSIVPLDASRTALAGAPTRLVSQDQPWEGRLIEAPTLLRHDDGYVLLYSANDYNSLDYAIGYATAPTPTGPWTKAADPLLTTDASDWRYYGPGGQDVVAGPDGTDRILFHSWDELHEYRGIHSLPLDWNGTAPEVSLPAR